MPSRWRLGPGIVRADGDGRAIDAASPTAVNLLGGPASVSPQVS